MDDPIEQKPGEWTAARYRQRAEQCRRMAEKAIYAESRAAFLRVAKSYEELADLEERREGFRERGQV